MISAVPLLAFPTSRSSLETDDARLKRNFLFEKHKGEACELGRDAATAQVPGGSCKVHSYALAARR